ncbi:hypothetical protein C2845_PM03G18210 [Panicum miliaceum]|uniref:Uncharacterized protein n=1 Tax=Panicum miliaceum TaxID=4540 RepID=A0A3L6TEX5_PANMI|nr:hypothetical protein C2845_PM03G18210 [Panicum miliaceum]
MLGMHYIGQVLNEVLFGNTTNQEGSGAAVRLHDDVKARVAEFLGQMKSTRIGADWAPVFVCNGLDDCFELMAWHLATWYCELVEKAGGGGGAGGGDDDSREKNRRVAIALSRYCVYLVVSAPELLPGPSEETKHALDEAQNQILEARGHYDFRRMLARLRRRSTGREPPSQDNAGTMGVYWGKRLLNETPPPALLRPMEGAGAPVGADAALRRAVRGRAAAHAAPGGGRRVHHPPLGPALPHRHRQVGGGG